MFAPKRLIGCGSGGWDTVGSGDGHFSLNFGVAIDSATQIMSPGTESANSAMSSQTALVSDGEHHTWDATSNAQPIITSLPQAFGSSLTTSAACSTTSNLANWGTAYSYGTMYGTSAGSVSAASTGGFLSGGGNTSSWTLPKGPMTLAPKASSASQDVSTQSRRPTVMTQS